MALIKSEQLRISGSDLQTGIPTAGAYNIDVLNISMSIADALNVIAIGSGSTVWSIESDGSISRNSDVEMTGSFIVAGAAKFGDSADDIHQFTGSIRQSGSESYFMNNVGIGTDNPDALLEVEAVAAIIHIDGSNAKIRVDRATNTSQGWIQYETSASMKWIAGLTPANGHDDYYISDAWSDATPPEFMIQRTTGNVGIGTTNPSTKLHVNGAISASQVTASSYEASDGVFRSFQASTGNVIEFQALGSAGYPRAGFLMGDTDDSFNNASLWVAPRGANQLSTGLEALTNSNTALTATKRVAIRATTTENQIYSAKGNAASSDVPLHIYANGVSGDVSMAFLTTGEVGIGTTTPQTKLHVVGEISASSISASGDIHVGGHIFADCCYGEMFISASTAATVIGSANTWYQVDGFEGGLSGSSVHYSGSTLENDHTGVYVLEWQASVAAATINDIFQVGVSINDATPEVKTIIERKFGNNDVGALSGRAFLALTTGDLVTLKVFNVDGTGNITAKFANLGYRRM